MRLSAILCTHNPRWEYLLRCFEALGSQTLSDDQWELVVVDNCSNRPIAALDQVKEHAHWRVVSEAKLGLTRARLRGIREAVGDLLVFVDDDNVIDQDFLQTALRIADERPYLGSWSGQCRPEFETTPPDWTRPYRGNLVIREFANDVWSNLPRLAETMPCGAGLCVRRTVAMRYLHLHAAGDRGFQLDRVGSSLVSGGDNDLAACACDLGLGVGLVASLKLTHLIPTERLSLDYLCRLTEGIYYSGAILDYYRGQVDPGPSVARRLSFWLRLPFQGIKRARIALAVEHGRSQARAFIKDERALRERSSK